MTTTPPLAESSAMKNHHRPTQHSSLGLWIGVETQPGGLVTLPATPDYVLKMHTGSPLRGTCALSQRFFYRSGDLDIFAPGPARAWHSEDASTSVLLRLGPTLVRHAAQEQGLIAKSACIEPRHQFRNSQVENITWALEAECRAGFPNGPLYVDSLGLALAIQLIRRHHAQLVTRNGLSKRQLSVVIDHIEAHLQEKVSLLELSELAGLSASHFRTLFKRSTGVPVHEYLIRRRVDRARALLLAGELPASQVAVEAGFAHQSHMARCMRRILGTTPSHLLRHA